MKSALSLLLILSINALLGQAPTFQDVDYVGNGDPKQFLDVYIPPNLNAPAPMVMYIHGGAWVSGQKGGAMSFLDSLYSSGYIIVDINYRLRQDSIWPAQIFDCKTAVRFLKANANTYSIDTCRMGVIGTSAGAHLAAMLGTSNGTMEGLHLGSTGVSTRINAVISLFPAVDFFQMQAHMDTNCPPTSMTHCSYNSAEARLLGCDSCVMCPAKVTSANPITYIDPSDPPFKVMHGDSDCGIPWHQSFLLDSALNANNVNSSLHLIPGAVHSDPWFRTDSAQGIYRGFFDANLSPCFLTGTNENYSVNDFSVFPNPATGHVQIIMPGIVKECRVLLSEINGKVLQCMKYSSISVEMALSGYSKGIYFITVESAIGNITKKLIIQ